MRYVFAQTPCEVSQQLAPTADAGTVSWTLRDNQGTVASTGQVANLASDIVARTTITAAANAKTLPSETRFVSFDWRTQGQSRSAMQSYVLVDFMPLRVDIADVRAALGANSAELPDADIDLPSAAFLVREQLGAAVFDPMLTAGTTATIHLNRMVALWAAAGFMTSLPLRIVESMGNEQAKFARARGIDLGAVVEGLRGEYERLREIVLGIDDAHATVPLLFTTSRPGIDAIRGPSRWSNFPAWSPYFRP